MTEGGSPDEDPAVLSLDHAVIFAGELGASKSHASSPVGHSAHQPTRAALTVLGWTLPSAFALRGLSLRCRVAYPARGTVRPEPQVAPQHASATEDFSDLDEEADNISQFQQR
ncbi:hypothetical protein [Streptomyces mirabilis]|uniref:hypothetical protein n=1 Tax=Streptomyces mirabilis TaxID=68239 RepID=UPI0035DD5EAB